MFRSFRSTYCSGYSEDELINTFGIRSQAAKCLKGYTEESYITKGPNYGQRNMMRLYDTFKGRRFTYRYEKMTMTNANDLYKS